MATRKDIDRITGLYRRCDAIMKELTAIRRFLQCEYNRKEYSSDVLEQMHQSARRMREMAERECRRVERRCCDVFD